MKSLNLYVTLVLIVTAACAEQEIIDGPAEWTADAVWYQIFPERFNNGDPSNDPKLSDTYGSWPFDDESEWEIMPWTSDWYELQPWEEKNANGFYWNAQRRRYGGDLQGIIDKLDYLEELGVNALYLNPVFESPSLHKYDGASYHHIDDNFGPDPDYDKELIAGEIPEDPDTWVWTTADKLFLELIEEVHKRDMKIIIDGVFNHTGLEFWAFKDILENQESSEYLNWYNILSFDDPATEEDEFDYQCWYGARTLPEIKETGAGLIPEAEEYIFNSVRRWMDPDGDGDPSDGIDGWRLDVAEMVGIPFWKKFNSFVSDINPEAFLMGEVWWDDWQNNVMVNAKEYIGPEVFDAVMNYRFGDAAYQYFINEDKKISSSDMVNKLLFVEREYDNRYLHALPNYFDSHDTERLASVTLNPDIPIDHFGNYSSNRDLDASKPDSIHYEKVLQLLAFQMTYRGAPAIYYGTEVGMWGLDDPDERKPMIWDELVYDDEDDLPFGEKMSAEKVGVNHDLLARVRELISLRKENIALRRGELKFDAVSDPEDYFSFVRDHETQKLYIVFNNSEATIEFQCPYGIDEVLFGEGASYQAGKIFVKANSFGVYKITM